MSSCGPTNWSGVPVFQDFSPLLFYLFFSCDFFFFVTLNTLSLVPRRYVTINPGIGNGRGKVKGGGEGGGGGGGGGGGEGGGGFGKGGTVCKEVLTM